VTTVTEHAPVEPALVEARRLLERVQHALTADRPAPHLVHGVVEGTHQLTTALSDLVTTLIDRAPTALAATDGADGHLAKELVADLRAMNGCLTTGALLLAPALDDLRGLTRPGRATAMSELSQPAWADELPPADLEPSS
jgi:hypothetical protein